jgi:hypothetical protein
LHPGDIVIFPQGDPHLMRCGRPTGPVDKDKQFELIFTQGLEVVRMGGGRDATHFICGYLTCEPQLSNMLLGGLPPLVSVNIRGEGPSGWLENAIRLSVANGRGAVPGAEAVLARLSEVLFVENFAALHRG